MSTAFAGRVIEALGPAFDDRAGPLLPAVVDGLTAPLAESDDLLAPAARGWATVFDLDTTPTPALIGQATGTTVPRRLSLEEQRAYVRDRAAWRRGTPGAIIGAVQGALVGDTRRVQLVERDGSPWRTTIRVWESDLPAGGQPAVLAAALTQKPVGIVLTVEVRAGASYTHLSEEHGTYTALAAEFPTYDALSTHLPEEGTTP